MFDEKVKVKINKKWEKKYGNKLLKKMAKDCDSLEMYHSFVRSQRNSRLNLIKALIAAIVLTAVLVATFFVNGLVFLGFILLIQILDFIHSSREESLNGMNALLYIKQEAFIYGLNKTIKEAIKKYEKEGKDEKSNNK